MLEVFQYGERIQTPCALVLGGFDGLHAGHMTLIAAAKRRGLPVCITTIYGFKGGVLFTREERRDLFARAGIDFVYEIEFTDSIRETSAVDFLTTLFHNIPAQAVICGEDFRFGRDAIGTPKLIKEQVSCSVEILPPYMVGEKKMSTSLVKKLLSRGEMNAIDRVADYFVMGTVEHGRQVGRTYGFPTLNISVPEEKLLPPDGVYAGYAVTPQGNYNCIINIGARPTFGVEESKLEAHLIGFSGDLYGETVRISPTGFIRPIMRFSSAEELREQLEKDKKNYDKVWTERKL